MTRRVEQTGKHSGPGRLRIVAGKWRSRLLQIADAPGLRPTPERIRETLFNWLTPELAGAVCLDLFAGTGALGLEALSRGARRAVFVERIAGTARVLKQNIDKLGTERATVLQMDGIRYLSEIPTLRFDIVFLDPPFADDNHEDLCRLLHLNGWLADSAKVYLERPLDAADLRLPEGWEVMKEKTAGNVRYFLLEAP